MALTQENDSRKLTQEEKERMEETCRAGNLASCQIVSIPEGRTIDSVSIGFLTAGSWLFGTIYIHLNELPEFAGTTEQVRHFELSVDEYHEGLIEVERLLVVQRIDFERATKEKEEAIVV